MTTPNSKPADKRPEKYLRQRRLARETALQYLYQADQQDEWTCSEVSVESFKRQARKLHEKSSDVDWDKAWEYTVHLLQGICRNRNAVDNVLQDCAENWTLSRMNVIDRNILRLAAFEILYSPNIPRVTAINEAVELAKSYGDRDSSRFVNGILDKVLHQVEGKD